MLRATFALALTVTAAQSFTHSVQSAEPQTLTLPLTTTTAVSTVTASRIIEKGRALDERMAESNRPKPTPESPITTTAELNEVREELLNIEKIAPEYADAQKLLASLERRYEEGRAQRTPPAPRPSDSANYAHANEFNWNPNQYSSNYVCAQMVADAGKCLHNAAFVGLTAGMRNRDQLREFIYKLCRVSMAQWMVRCQQEGTKDERAGRVVQYLEQVMDEAIKTGGQPPQNNKRSSIPPQDLSDSSNVRCFPFCNSR
jgi:hypothetical protein